MSDDPLASPEQPLPTGSPVLPDARAVSSTVLAGCQCGTVALASHGCKFILRRRSTVAQVAIMTVDAHAGVRDHCDHREVTPVAVAQ